MTRLEREEFIKSAERAHATQSDSRVMTGADATQWMTAQGD